MRRALSIFWILAAAVCLIASTGSARAKLSTHDGDAVLKRLDITPVRDCSGGAGMLQMSGQRIIDTCDAAIAAVIAARSSERSPNTGKTALYDLFEANMWLGKTFGIARQNDFPSQPACEAYSHYAELLGKVDMAALGPDFEDELNDEIEPATIALKACTHWVRANRDFVARGYPDHSLLLVQLAKSYANCVPDYQGKLSQDPDKLEQACGAALSWLDEARVEVPNFRETMGFELKLKRAQVLHVQAELEGARIVRISDAYCGLVEESNAAVYLVDPGTASSNAKSFIAQSVDYAEKVLGTCRQQFRTPPLPFRGLHVN